MKRRSFIKAATAVIFPAVKSNKCELCGERGHRMESGYVMSREDDFMRSPQESLAIWCQNAPINPKVYKKIRG